MATDRMGVLELLRKAGIDGDTDFLREGVRVLAEAALEALCERMPFGVRALQVDGGSEFMAGFEEACHGRGIELFTLPPRSPKLNGSVERANRTHAEEFYECSNAEPTVAALGAELLVWETTYNTVRPHQALGYLTPAEFLDRWRQDHADSGPAEAVV